MSNAGLGPERIFVAVALIVGLALVVLTPPYQAPDEPAHFLRVWQLSQLKILPINFGGYQPSSIGDSFIPFTPLSFHSEKKTTFAAILQEFHRPLNLHLQHFMPFPNTALYSPVPYLPQMMGVAVARKLRWAPVAALYAGRLMSLFAYTWLGWLAIRFTPVLKWPLTLVLAAPAPLSLAAGVSADPMTTAIACLAVALSLRAMLARQPLRTTEITALAITFVALALCKNAYIPLVALLFLIPMRNWNTRPRTGWLIPTGIALLSIAAVISWSALTHPLNVRERAGDPHVQLQWILHNPSDYSSVLISTAVSYGAGMMLGAIGTMGWMDTLLNQWVSLIYLLAIWNLVVNDNAPTSDIQIALPRWLPQAAAAAVFVSLVLVATSIYIVWDPAGTPTAEGIQGRYLLPLALAAMLMIRRERTGQPGQFQMYWPILLLLAMSGYTIWFFIQRYFLA